MFTGIVEEINQVKAISKRGMATLFEIKADRVREDLKIGDSVAVNGVCLTVVEKKTDTLSFEVMPETLGITNLKVLRVKDKVNLERALKIGDRVSGHFVTGHIDCLGIIHRKAYINSNFSFEIVIPQEFMKYIIPKGSVAIDGISLTIVDKKPRGFSVYIIPHTLKNTTLSFKGHSEGVNVEFDILLKKVNL